MTAWEIVSEVLKELARRTAPGVILSDLDKYAENYINSQGGVAISKGYLPTDWGKNNPKKPFPNALVVNVNSVIAHGEPTSYVLQEGNIVCYDLAVLKDGVCGDAALTIGVGKISSRDARLIRHALKTLYVGIDRVKAGVDIREISDAMDTFARRTGYVTSWTFAGHGIGKVVHQDPVIPNYLHPDHKEYRLKEGEMICLEPQLTYNDPVGMPIPDKWAWVTRDGRNVAMFEHQLLVTKDGCKILTTHTDRPEKITKDENKFYQIYKARPRKGNRKKALGIRK